MNPDPLQHLFIIFLTNQKRSLLVILGHLVRIGLLIEDKNSNRRQEFLLKGSSIAILSLYSDY